MALNDLHQEIKNVLDLTSRVDERLKAVQVRQEETHRWLQNLSGEINELASRVAVLESKNGHRTDKLEDDLHGVDIRLERIEANKATDEDIDGIAHKIAEIEHNINYFQQHTNTWFDNVKFYANLGIKIIWAIAMGYLLWKLGFNQAPSAPIIP